MDDMDVVEKYLGEGGSFGKTDKPDKKAEKAKKDIFKIVDKLAQAGMMVAKLPDDLIPRKNKGKVLDGVGDAVDELNKLKDLV